eukprot:GHRQ01015792.1.p1 GENE.GHRQ01015792.1~~GHRQ01015792.1.p1  ORF type:complete len:191 (+),score=21.95 GHRQ01015792.1:90-662(+)
MFVATRGCGLLLGTLTCHMWHPRAIRHPTVSPARILPALPLLPRLLILSNPAQNFVVAGGTLGGLIAVISQPLSYAPASPGPFTTILLDAQNSSPKPGSSITQYVWAVVDRVNLTADGKPTPVANVTGRLAQVRLRPGAYQVGLLVLDSDNTNAIAQKNFVAGPMPRPPPGEVSVQDMPPPPSPSRRSPG